MHAYMAAISGREFFEKTATGTVAAGLLAAGVAELRANPLGLPIGSQYFVEQNMELTKESIAFLKTLKV